MLTFSNWVCGDGNVARIGIRLPSFVFRISLNYGIRTTKYETGIVTVTDELNREGG